MEITKNQKLLTLASLWLGHFAVDFMLGIWSVYKTIAELDLAIAGLIAGICAFAGEGLQAYFGSLSDRGYRFHLILLGIFLSTASALMAYSDSYLGLFVIMLLTLIGSGAFHPCAASLVNSLSTSRQGLMMSIFQSGGGTGLAVSQIIFFYAFYQFEGHTALLAIPALVLVLALLYNSKKFTAFNTPPPQTQSVLKGFTKLFRHPELRLLYIAQVCNQTLVWGMLFLLPNVLLSRGYETWICFGGGHFAYVCGMTIFLLPVGYLADRFSIKTVVFSAFAIGLVSLYTFLLVPFLSAPLLFFVLLLIGGCLGSVSPLNVVYGNQLFPNNSGIVSAFLMGLVWCVAEGIGQLGGGLLTKLFTDDAPARALGCLGMLYIVGLWAFALLPKVVVPKPENTKAFLLEGFDRE